MEFRVAAVELNCRYNVSNFSKNTKKTEPLTGHFEKIKTVDSDRDRVHFD